MASLPLSIWAVVAVIAGGAVVGMLYALAASLRNEQAIRDLREEAAELRRRYLAQRGGGEVVEVIGDDEPAAAEPMRKAA